MADVSREYSMSGRNFKRKQLRKTELLFPNKKKYVKRNIGMVFLEED